MSVAEIQCVKDLVGLVGKPGWVEFLAMSEPLSPPSEEPSYHETAHEQASAVVFDMGGVLVRLASLPDLLGAGHDTAQFWPRWLASPAVRSFERGDGSPELFAADLVDELNLTITPEEFLTNFTKFCTGLYPGALELVRDVRQKVQTAILSNTNSLHWSGQIDAPVIQSMCDRNYLSFQLGLLKPDGAVYRYVGDDLGVPAANIVFLDDNQINVDGARQAGWRAYVVSGPEEARRCLIDIGVLGDTAD